MTVYARTPEKLGILACHGMSAWKRYPSKFQWVNVKCPADLASSRVVEADMPGAQKGMQRWAGA